MNTINVFTTEEIPVLMEEQTNNIHVVILRDHQDVKRVTELCDYYGYMTCKSDLINVVKLVKVGGV